MTRLQEALDGIEIDASELNKIQQLYSTQEGWAKCLNEYPNVVVLINAINQAVSAEDEPERPEFKAFIKLLQILALDFLESNYSESRIGWLMWWIGCYARYDSYYPMRWKHNYDPLNWYHWDEPKRPDDMYTMPADDPFNIQGKCYIHPEWYRNDKGNGTTENLSDNVSQKW